MYGYVKRGIDIVGATCLLVLCLIPLLVIGGVLFATQKQILFRQQRAGKGERVFLIYKFQTMTNARNLNGDLLPDEERVTRFGRFLRQTSLDELPQFFNILKGDMSFIGPRPLLVSYLPLYSEEEKKRHLVTPGLTGLAQVNGRNAISWQEKFRLDVLYVERFSFRQDITLFFQTFKKVLGSEGISRAGYVTTPPFEGHKK
nr:MULTISPECIES: sugar transferase [Listeria]